MFVFLLLSFTVAVLLLATDRPDFCINLFTASGGFH